MVLFHLVSPLRREKGSRVTTQRKLGTIGSAVADDNELDQSVLLLVGIRRGSVPHRPDLGSRLFELIDQPQNVVTARAPGMAREALAIDARIVAEGVEVESVDIGGMVVSVRWRPATGGISRSTRVTVR